MIETTPDTIQVGDEVVIWNKRRLVTNVAENDHHGTANDVYWEISLAFDDEEQTLIFYKNETLQVVPKPVVFAPGTVVVFKMLPDQPHVRRALKWFNANSAASATTPTDVEMQEFIDSGKAEVIYQPKEA